MVPTVIAVKSNLRMMTLFPRNNIQRGDAPEQIQDHANKYNSWRVATIRPTCAKQDD